MFKVGGPDGTPANPVATDAIFVLRNGHVIIDNAWLWRADHAAGAKVTYTSNRCKYAALAIILAIIIMTSHPFVCL